MVVEKPRSLPVLRDLPEPLPGPGEVVVRVSACAVCRTDLHLCDGELPRARYPVVPGHQIVGTVESAGRGAPLAPGVRVGIPWLGGACGSCRFCREGRENLCDRAVFTGADRDGGFAERCTADARFCLRLPGGIPDAEAAPLLCGGLIGWRALKLAPGAQRLGFYGFGSAAHQLLQVVRAQGRKVYAFTRPGDREAQAFARELGAAWAGGSDEDPPEKLDAALIFAPEGGLVPKALADLEKGGTAVCAGIHMSPIPSFPYALLWGERAVRSAANLTRKDAEEFLPLAFRLPVKTRVTLYPLEEAARALADLREGRLQGTAVLVNRS